MSRGKSRARVRNTLLHTARPPRRRRHDVRCPPPDPKKREARVKGPRTTTTLGATRGWSVRAQRRMHVAKGPPVGEIVRFVPTGGNLECRVPRGWGGIGGVRLPGEAASCGPPPELVGRAGGSVLCPTYRGRMSIAGVPGRGGGGRPIVRGAVRACAFPHLWRLRRMSFVWGPHHLTGLRGAMEPTERSP
jgi:hypothetical protein